MYIYLLQQENKSFSKFIFLEGCVALKRTVFVVKDLE